MLTIVKNEYCLTCSRMLQKIETDEGLDIYCRLETAHEEADGTSCGFYDPVGAMLSAYSDEIEVMQIGKISAAEVVARSLHTFQSISANVKFIEVQEDDAGDVKITYPERAHPRDVIHDMLLNSDDGEMSLSEIASVLNLSGVAAEFVFLWLAGDSESIETITFVNRGEGKVWCERWTHVSLNEEEDDEEDWEEGWSDALGFDEAEDLKSDDGDDEEGDN